MVVYEKPQVDRSHLMSYLSAALRSRSDLSGRSLTLQTKENYPKKEGSFKNVPPATVDVPHHVLDSVEVQVRDDDLVALALPHIVLEHCPEYRRPESNINLLFGRFHLG